MEITNVAILANPKAGKGKSKQHALWLQQQFIINKLYCTNANNSQNIYFVQFQTHFFLTRQ